MEKSTGKVLNMSSYVIRFTSKWCILTSFIWQKSTLWRKILMVITLTLSHIVNIATYSSSGIQDELYLGGCDEHIAVTLGGCFLRELGTRYRTVFGIPKWNDNQDGKAVLWKTIYIKSRIFERVFVVYSATLRSICV